MSLMVTPVKINVAVTDEFVVRDANAIRVTGLVAGSFTTELYNNGSTSAQTVTITAVGNGVYKFTFTPNALGEWHIVITHSTYGEWEGGYRCENFDTDDLAATAPGLIRTGTLQAATSTTATLDAGASSTTNLYQRCVLLITGGTGVGQAAQLIVSYVGASKIATVAPGWTVTPDNTSTFQVIALPGSVDVELWGNVAPSPLSSGKVQSDVRLWQALSPNNLISGRVDADLGLMRVRSGTAQGGASTSITLDSGASSTTSFYQGAVVILTGGTGSGQVRAILDYNSTTKVATVTPAWATTPDATTTFVVYQLPGWTVADVWRWRGSTPNVLTAAGNVQSDLEEWEQVVPSGLSGGAVPSNVTKWGGSTPNTLASGCVQADVERWATGIPNALISGRVDANAQVVGDKTGYTLSSAGVQAVWDALTSNLTTVGSIGKLLTTDIDATISSRLPTSSYTAPPSVVSIVNGVWDELQSSHNTAGTFGKLAAFLDAAVSSRADGANYTAARALKIDNLDATVSSRAAPADILVTPANKLATDASGRVTLTPAEEAAIAAAVWAVAGAIDGTLTPSQAVMYIFAAVAGVSSGEPSGASDTFKGPSGTVRLTSTYDADDNRTAVVLG